MIARADHQVVPRSDEWYTPRAIVDALGPFDLDPCAAIERPWPTAAVHYTIEDNGLMKPWDVVVGRPTRVWMNPVYKKRVIDRWMARMAAHGVGTALVNARTDTEWFFASVWSSASALLFIYQRIHFVPGDRTVERNHNGHASVLVAYGIEDMDRLADSGIEGAFVPLASRGQVVAVFRPREGASWSELLAELVDRAGGTVTLATAYVLVADHPKRAANRNWQAKVRQILQGPRFERVERATYRLAGV